MFSGVGAHSGNKRSINPIGLDLFTANTEHFMASYSLLLAALLWYLYDFTINCSEYFIIFFLSNYEHCIVQFLTLISSEKWMTFRSQQHTEFYFL